MSIKSKASRLLRGEMKIQEILKQPEGKTLEFKKELPRNRRNLLKTLVAFANGAGGNIYVGVRSCENVR